MFLEIAQINVLRLVTVVILIIVCLVSWEKIDNFRRTEAFLIFAVISQQVALITRLEIV